MTTTLPESGTTLPGISIDVNSEGIDYGNNYETGTPSSVNYENTYDVFVLIVQKSSGNMSFEMRDFIIRGHPICSVPGTEYCDTCWTPPPPPPSFWEGAIWAFNGNTGSNNDRLVDEVILNPGLYDDDIPIAGGNSITGNDAIHGNYVTLGSNDGTTPNNYYTIGSPAFRLECNNFTGATLSFIWRNVNNPDQTGGHIIQVHHQQSGHAAHMGFWVGVVADTGLMTKVVGNYATLNHF